MEMGRRGRKRQLLVEDEYWKLILAGVGRSRSAGWSGSLGRPAIGGEPNEAAFHRCGWPRPADRGTRYLSLRERQRIATLGAQGCSVREIARRLERPASTVSRESDATSLRTTVATTTPTLRTPGLENGPDAPGRHGWRSRTVCALWCRPSSSWSGALSRSVAGYG